LASAKDRLAAIDGRLPDLDTNPSRHLVPWISDNWSSHFKWRGEGAMPPGERDKLERIVNRAHAQGRMVRFWGAPDREPIWREQIDAGVDLINTDRLEALRKFLSDSSLKRADLGRLGPRGRLDGEAF
jgi:glycerophosphoryl diester phosphodiesterase